MQGMSTVTVEEPPEEIVRGFLDALRSGRVVDALDVFALDGTIRDAKGQVHRGIREIAKFVNRASSEHQKVEAITRKGDAVTAIVRSATGRRQDRLRHTYTIGDGRVRSLRIDAGGRSRRTGASHHRG